MTHVLVGVERSIKSVVEGSREEKQMQSQGMKEAASTEEGDGQLFPAVYRLDCIVNYKILEERFRVSYGERFEESEFRKRFHPGMDGEWEIV